MPFWSQKKTILLIKNKKYKNQYGVTKKNA
jgi:hypothetical protein